MHIARRTRKRFASLAVIGIVAWLLAFAAHLHVQAKLPEAGSGHAHHVCLLCAAFQPGAGPAATFSILEAEKTSWTVPFVHVPALLQGPRAVYLSRAPPFA